MKPIIFIVLMVLACIVNTPEAHALFGHVAVERDKRIAIEQKLSEQEQKLMAQQQISVEQQKATSRWQTATFILGIATVFMLIAGTAIGSKGRHDAAAGK